MLFIEVEDEPFTIGIIRVGDVLTGEERTALNETLQVAKRVVIIGLKVTKSVKDMCSRALKLGCTVEYFYRMPASPQYKKDELKNFKALQEQGVVFHTPSSEHRTFVSMVPVGLFTNQRTVVFVQLDIECILAFLQGSGYSDPCLVQDAEAMLAGSRMAELSQLSYLISTSLDFSLPEPAQSVEMFEDAVTNIFSDLAHYCHGDELEREKIITSYQDARDRHMAILERVIEYQECVSIGLKFDFREVTEIIPLGYVHRKLDSKEYVRVYVFKEKCVVWLKPFNRFKESPGLPDLRNIAPHLVSGGRHDVLPYRVEVAHKNLEKFLQLLELQIERVVR